MLKRKACLQKSMMGRCRNCSGNGTVTCPNCNGKGGWGNWQQGKNCSGSGKVKCSNCSGPGWS